MKQNIYDNNTYHKNTQTHFCLFYHFSKFNFRFPLILYKAHDIYWPIYGALFLESTSKLHYFGEDSWQANLFTHTFT